MSYEYIASGMSYIWKFNNFDRETQPELVKTINMMMDNLCAKFPNHGMGILFNGYTEKSLGPRIQSIFGKYPIHVDSGGLQMITLGRTITEELKDKVYEVQAKYGSVGMSFDKIPVKLVGDRSDRVSMEGRFFDPSIFDDCAIESGKNLARQIEVFLEKDTKCRPMMIIQGNDQHWYQRWSDLVLKQIPQDHWQYIDGIASGAAALGQGMREDVERVWALSQLEAPDHMKKKFHMLGFGSMNRLIPIIEFQKAGLFDKDVLFSYDSTKHTGGVSRGQTQDGPGIFQMTRHRDAKFYYIYNKIDTVCREVFGTRLDEDDFFYAVGQMAPDAHAYYAKTYGKDKRVYERNLAAWTFFLYGVWAVMHYVELMEQDDTFVAAVRPRDHHCFITLKHVKTQEDYNYWKNHLGRGLRSAGVQSTKDNTTLEGFFQ